MTDGGKGLDYGPDAGGRMKGVCIVSSSLNRRELHAQIYFLGKADRLR